MATVDPHSTTSRESDVTIGFLHPGKMGVTLAAEASGRAEVLWAGQGRSPATAARAESVGLVDVGTIGQLTRRADVVVSICPPAAAVSVADQVAACDFDGIYVDANAISPTTSAEVGRRFERYVDGSVIGPPATAAGTTRLYLAGAEAETVAAAWEGSMLDAKVLADPSSPGAASALKMAYAGWTKGQAALLLAVNALARSAGVDAALIDEWKLSQPDLVALSARAAKGVAPKAWRFQGEMDEIAATMDAVDLPSGFHSAAAEVYRRLAGFKEPVQASGAGDADPVTPPDLAAVLAALIGSD